jgi:hypothetical protein
MVGHVDRVELIAAGADDVNGILADGKRRRTGNHRVDKAGHLVGRLALHGDSSQKAGDERALNSPVKNLSQSVRGVVTFEVRAVGRDDSTHPAQSSLFSSSRNRAQA